MNYNIKLEMSMDANSLNTLLGTLGSGPHNFVRPIIDNVLAQAKEQEDAARAAQAATTTDAEVMEVGGTD
jgi:hypothetical protein